MTPLRSLLVLTAASLVVRVASAFVVAQPGYTDAYYYLDVAARLARGMGLTADFIWGPIELGALPVVSHRFWMPMATTLQAAGIGALGSFLPDVRAAQAAIIAVALLIPVLTYACAREAGARAPLALVAATLAALGGLFAPAWVALDGFAPAAVLGGLFFLAYARAARGSVRAGVAAGLLVGLLFLTRSEGALFGLALLALTLAPSTRRAGVAGAVCALAIGIAWLARDAAAGMPRDLLARTALLVRYEDFFALASPDGSAVLASLGSFLGAKLAALATNASTFAFAFALLPLLPLAVAVRARWDHAAVRAWSGLALVVYLAQSLVWTLHSTRGSYFHSLAAFVPFGLALAAAGTERLLASRDPRAARAWTWGAIVLVGALSAGSLAQWDASFNGGLAARRAALDAIPSGPFFAIDAAAWRWIADRPVYVTPADGPETLGCVATGASALVLEDAHFRAYDDLYRGGARPAWLGAPIERGGIRVFPITGRLPSCFGVR